LDEEVTVPIETSLLLTFFLMEDGRTTVRQVLDRDDVDEFPYIVVRLASGQYAVVMRSELVEVLEKRRDTRVLDTALGDLLAPLAADAVEQDSMDTDQARDMVEEIRGKRLVVLAHGRVQGLLFSRWAVRRLRPDRQVMDLLVAPQPSELLEEVGFVAIPKTPGVLRTAVTEEATEELSLSPEAEPGKRWINAEIEDHDKDKSLRMGEVYTLAFDVDTRVRAESVVTDADFRYRFQAGEQMVELTVQLESDDFEIYTGPQTLRVPRTGKSKGKARFDIEPKQEGEGIINAVFLKDGNFIQVITLKLYTGDLFSSEVLGRPVDAAFAVRPRDVNLTILNTGAGFQIIMSGAVGAMATLPITLEELDQWIAEVRQVLRDEIVYMKGPSGACVYQSGIDIPAEINQVALQRLARTGFRLYQRIFYGPAADAQVNLLGDRLRQMAQRERLRIQIFSQQFMLPWGILYVADEYDANDVVPEMFLGLRHIIEHIPLQPSMQVTDRTIDSRSGLAVSLNVNADIDEQVKRSIVAEQWRYWKKIGQGGDVQVCLRRTGEDVTRALADTATPDQIFYFYCHAISRSLEEGGGPDASTLVLTDNGRLTLGDLYMDAPLRKILSGAPLVFINACESAELSPLFYDGFVPYFMAKGARGVIGTECETPALFAAEWARRFFDRFLAGELLGQVFLDLRQEFYRQHNNLLGLLYALYVDGDTQIEPAVQAMRRDTADLP